MITYMTAKDAGDVLNLTPSAVRLMERRGDIVVSATTVGGIRLFTAEEVKRALVSRMAKRQLVADTRAFRATNLAKRTRGRVK